MKNSIKKFDELANGYDKYRRGYSDDLFSWLDAFLNHNRRIWLDVGCGNGLFTFGIAPNSSKVIGADSSVKMLNKARSNVSIHNVEFILSEGVKLPFQDNAFSVASFAMAIHHMDMTKAIAEAIRVVIPNGYIIVITDNPEKGTWHAELSNTIYLAENRREPHFPKIGELTDCFYTAGLGDITIKHFPISIEYTISEYIEMLSNKPFSTALLMSDIEWSKACNEVKKALLEKYGNLEELIHDEIVYSVIAGRKVTTKK